MPVPKATLYAATGIGFDKADKIGFQKGTNFTYATPNYHCNFNILFVHGSSIFEVNVL